MNGAGYNVATADQERQQNRTDHTQVRQIWDRKPVAAMKRAYRLRRPDQFRRTRREGRTYTTPLVHMNVRPNRRRQSRFGFVVGKRIGKAVERNRARRRMREAVRLSIPAISPGYDIVFVIRDPAVIDLPFHTLQTTVRDLLQRTGLWQTPEAPATPTDTSTDQER
jgi:ribonuclease P protein component